MAYGRLDIFWPDGNFESYLLTQPTTSVGRAAGNTIALDTNTVSRYHFSLTQDNEQVSIADLESENGTFVDGVRITEPFVLEGVAEIQVGHLRMIFQPVDDEPTLPITPTEDADTQRIERDEINLRLDVDVTALDVWPASSASTELSILNSADDKRRFKVQVVGLPEDWVRISRTQLEIDGGVTVYVLIHIKPPRRHDIVPTMYRAGVQVIPLDQPEATVEAPIDVRVHGFTGLGVAIDRQEVEPDGLFRVFLHNQGSVMLPLQVQPVDADSMLSFILPTTPLQLAPGEQAQLDGRVLPRQRPLTGSAVTAHFHLLFRAQTAANFTAVVGGQMTVNPLLPLWGVITGAGIVISLLLLILLALFGAFSPPPQPAILDLTVNQTQIAQGEPLIVRWQTEDARRVRVLLNGLAIADLEADLQRHDVQTTELSGTVSVQLIAENDGVNTSAVRDVYIYRPMTLQRFQVLPTQLVRNVVGSLSVLWEVPGAISTQISGLRDFSNAPMQTAFEESGRIENLVGIPSRPLEVTLLAEDEVGNLLQETRRVELIDPQCTATDSVQLHEGPDDLYQVLSTVPTGGTVVVDAQDAASGWLRVELPGAVSGWGPRGLFVCDNRFKLEDLRKDVPIPPLQPADPTTR
jgi:hypothetical protein